LIPSSLAAGSVADFIKGLSASSVAFDNLDWTPRSVAVAKPEVLCVHAEREELVRPSSGCRRACLKRIEVADASAKAASQSSDAPNNAKDYLEIQCSPQTDDTSKRAGRLHSPSDPAYPSKTVSTAKLETPSSAPTTRATPGKRIEAVAKPVSPADSGCGSEARAARRSQRSVIESIGSPDLDTPQSTSRHEGGASGNKETLGIEHLDRLVKLPGIQGKLGARGLKDMTQVTSSELRLGPRQVRQKAPSAKLQQSVSGLPPLVGDCQTRSKSTSALYGHANARQRKHLASNSSPARCCDRAAGPRGMLASCSTGAL